MSARTIPHIGPRTPDDKNRILTPGDEYNPDYNEGWKLTRQWGWIKKLGLGTVFTFITAVAGTTLVISNLAAPVVKQGELNGGFRASIDSLTAAQIADREEASKREEKRAEETSATLKRIEAAVNVAVDLGKQNQLENRAHAAELVELRQDTKALWKWGTGLERQIGILEAEIKQRSK